jgi:ubiquinone/menaquinone biosynthesis C-methylase UbiE
MNPIQRSLAITLLALLAPVALGQRGQTEGINEQYKANGLNVQEWVARFQGESREVFTLRQPIAKALRLRPGQSVADIGAGTGLYVPFLAQAVGPEGKVFAVDIAPAFVEHIAKRAKESKLPQVRASLGTERSIELPANSVDVAFTSDAYHHFVHYQDMLASIHKALKPGGEFIVLDFDIESKSVEPWLVEHVGHTTAEFRRQIEEAGFRFVKDETLPEMKTNFMYRFVKQ